MRPRHRVRRRGLEGADAPDVIALGARRERDVLDERQDLDHGQAVAEGHGGQREAEPRQARVALARRVGIERQVECEQPRRDEHVIRHLEVAQQRERHGDGEQAVAFLPPVPDRQHQREQRQRQRGRGEQLAVVPGRGVRGQEAGQLVREAAGDRAGPGEPEAPEQQVGEQARRDEVDHEVEIHDGLDGQQQPEERRRVEDVAVAGAHERHAAEQLGLPQRHVPEALPPLGAPGPEGVAGRDLVAHRVGEPLPRQHGQREDRHPQGEEPGRHERGVPRLVAVRGRRLIAGHAGPFPLRPPSASAPSPATASVSVSSSREATLNAMAPPTPRYGVSRT